MGRIFSVRINIDDVSASLDFWPSDQERSAWLRGFMAGLRGAPNRWQEGPESNGHALGAAGYADSVAWRERQAQGGKRSAESRQAKHGSSNPRANREVEPEVVCEVTSQLLGTEREVVCEPIQSTNQPINCKPSTSRARSTFTPPTLSEVAAYCQERNRGVNPDKWMAHYESNGWMVGKNKMKSWQAAVRTWESSVSVAKPETAYLDHTNWRPGMTQAEIDAKNKILDDLSA